MNNPHLPAQGRSSTAVLEDLERYRAGDVRWREGRTWALVYDPGEAVWNTAKRAYHDFLGENGLDPIAFPSLRRLENELVSAVLAQVQAPPGAVGSFTSGGTDSIITAVKTARGLFREAHPGRQGRIVMPETAHAAFHKAAELLDLAVDAIPVDPISFQVDPAKMAAAAGPDTALLVASAPGYAHGVIDPVAEIAALAHERGLWLHVDGCVGGWIAPWYRRAGDPVPVFDFSLPGVSSMSVDLHKYGFTPKSASIVAFRDPAWRRHQVFSCARWPGYTIVNGSLQSSRTGGPMAGAWATLQALGEDGYAGLVEAMREAATAVKAGIRDRIPALRLLGDPQLSLLAYASDTVDVFRVVDQMEARGWTIQVQLSFGTSPANIHLSVNPSALPLVGPFLDALEESVAAAEAAGPVVLPPELVEQVVALAQADPAPEAFAAMLGAFGGGEGLLPTEMAPINALLDRVPPETREVLVRGVWGLMFSGR